MKFFLFPVLFLLITTALYGDELNTEFSYCFDLLENNPSYYYYSEDKEELYFYHYIKLGLSWQGKADDAFTGYVQINFHDGYEISLPSLQYRFNIFKINFGSIYYYSEITDVLGKLNLNYDFGVELTALLPGGHEVGFAASLYDSNQDGYYDYKDLLMSPFIVKYKANFLNMEILYYFNHYFYAYQESGETGKNFNEQYKNILSLKLIFPDFELYNACILNYGADRIYLDRNSDGIITENLRNNQFHINNLTGCRYYFALFNLKCGLSFLYKQYGYSMEELGNYYFYYKQILNFERAYKTICDEENIMKYYILGSLSSGFFNNFQLNALAWYSFEEKLLFLDVYCYYYMTDLFLQLGLVKYIKFDEYLVTSADFVPKTEICATAIFSYKDFRLQATASYWLDALFETENVLQNHKTVFSLALTKKF